MDFELGQVCPLTRLPLKHAGIEEARRAIAGGRPLLPRHPTGHDAKPYGETNAVMLRSDLQAAYPIIEDFPVLLSPEVLRHPDHREAFNIIGSHYEEAYSESEFYNRVASTEASVIRNTNSLASIESESVQHLAGLAKYSQSELLDFREPVTKWLSGRMDLGSETDCFTHLESVADLDTLQIGGKGISAVLFLLAGARSATLITPMIGEARFARELARFFGVLQKFRCVISIAEEIPFENESFDRVFSAGCVHHMTTEEAFPEIARVMRSGGRFAALEPWRAPLYAFGTALLGKREVNAFCRPLTAARVAPLYSSFSAARAVQHGTLTRYPMLALEKFGLRIPLKVALRVGSFDDACCTLLPPLRRFGSGVALLATK